MQNFNNNLDGLLNYLECEFTFMQSDISYTKTNIEILRWTNPKMIVDQFLQYILPYKNHIFECNEKFFLNFEENIEELNQTNLLFGLKLKQAFLNGDAKKIMRQKATIFYYFQKLIIYAEQL
jgi:hypothetical protein